MRRPSGKLSTRVVFRLALVVTALGLLAARTASAQAVEVDARTMFFHAPATDLTVRPWDFLAVSAGWEADIVSGASERIKAGPLTRNPDITTGASVKDVRHMGRGSVTVKRDVSQLTLGGSESVENDYKSRSFN